MDACDDFAARSRLGGSIDIRDVLRGCTIAAGLKANHDQAKYANGDGKVEVSENQFAPTSVARTGRRPILSGAYMLPGYCSLKYVSTAVARLLA